MELAEAALVQATLSQVALSPDAPSQTAPGAGPPQTEPPWIASAGNRTVYATGSLIHNSQAMEPLKQRGLAILEEGRLPEDLGGAPVIIRAHGISPEFEAALAGRGARIVDATCPRVKASQIKARELRRLGYRIFLAGERGHAEITGILGYAPDCVVVRSPGEASLAAEKLRGEDPPAKTALIGQTTWDSEEYAAIAGALRSSFPDLEVCGTICDATRSRQDSLRALCAEVDAVLVAGSRESANTRRLLDIARSFRDAGGRLRPAWLVECPEEIPAEIGQYPVVGLCAGASTPDDVINAIEKALLEGEAGP